MKEDKYLLKVALIDRDVIARKKLKSRLESCSEFKISVIWESDAGTDLTGILSNAHIDIIFTDIWENDVGELKFLQLLANSSLCRCVVVVSERTDFEYVKKSFISGAFDYISKPVKICDVRNVLERAEGLLKMEPLPCDSENYGEYELIECIKHHGLYMQSLTEDFINHYLNLDGFDSACFKINIANPLQHITQELCREFGWLKNIIPPFQYTRERMFNEENIEYVIFLVKDYLSMLCKKLDEYYPEIKSEISKKVIDYILNSPYEKHLLSDVADIMFTSNTYLSHTFKMDIGVSFVDYCNRYKIESAKILLLYSDLNIKEIADKLHYEDYKYMGRLFKNMVGTTPTKYRNDGTY